jgi:hypothetical protein
VTAWSVSLRRDGVTVLEDAPVDDWDAACLGAGFVAAVTGKPTSVSGAVAAYRFVPDPAQEVLDLGGVA